MTATYQFDGDRIEWSDIDDPTQSYPCTYQMAILGADPEAGRLDMIVRWPPNSYCHFHRHVADTAILVLEGEQHIVEVHDDGTEGEHKVRPAGDGPVFETLDRDMNVLNAATVADMAQTPTLGAG